MTKGAAHLVDEVLPPVPVRLRCPRCAGRMQLIATIEDSAVAQRILAHLGLPGAQEDPRPPLPLTIAAAEQRPVPGVIVSTVSGVRAAADVCPGAP